MAPGLETTTSKEVGENQEKGDRNGGSLAVHDLVGAKTHNFRKPGIFLTENGTVFLYMLHQECELNPQDIRESFT